MQSSHALVKIAGYCVLDAASSEIVHGESISFTVKSSQCLSSFLALGTAACSRGVHMIKTLEK